MIGTVGVQHCGGLRYCGKRSCLAGIKLQSLIGHCVVLAAQCSIISLRRKRHVVVVVVETHKWHILKYISSILAFYQQHFSHVLALSTLTSSLMSFGGLWSNSQRMLIGTILKTYM